jgi:4-aminobutyrate aminotransferase-like enzyme
VLRLIPPLTITDDELDLALRILGDALAAPLAA